VNLNSRLIVFFTSLFISFQILKSLVFLRIENKEMKKIVILLMASAIGVALYQQSLAEKNIYIMVVAIVIFMMGMMRLSSKTPSKNENKDEDGI
jgi:phosphatidylserine synthase